jgi:hypothetical protein
MAVSRKPESFTFQDVEKIDFSDITKYAGYSVLEQKSDEQKHQKYAGSAVVYGVPVSLSYDDSKSLSNYLLQKSGFAFSKDTRFAMVRTALSSIAEAMYKECLAVPSIKLEIPRQAYTEKSFQLAVTWDSKIKTPQNVNYEMRVIGGDVEGKTKLTGKMPEKVAKLFQMDKTAAGDLMQIDLVVYGQKYPSIVIPRHSRCSRSRLLSGTAPSTHLETNPVTCAATMRFWSRRMGP